jgi:bifunctional non-homologous end joining protein LigD
MFNTAVQKVPMTLFHRPFGMKKHWASKLHYDLRLEWNGRLLSWAIPMGPTRTIGIERKAIQMPDHRLDYLAFEGLHETGTIMFWDRGTWILHPEHQDIERCLEQGVLRFGLYGEKLEGTWTLKRTAENEHGSPIWLLSKDADYAAVPDDDDLLEERSNSVKTGRTREQIERDWIEGKKESGTQTFLF